MSEIRAARRDVRDCRLAGLFSFPVPPYISPAGSPAMEINGRRNKPFGPGGSTRRLHQSPTRQIWVLAGAKQDRRGRKGLAFSRYGSAVIGLCNSCKRQLCSGCSGCVTQFERPISSPDGLSPVRRGSEAPGNRSLHFTCSIFTCSIFTCSIVAVGSRVRGAFPKPSFRSHPFQNHPPRARPPALEFSARGWPDGLSARSGLSLAAIRSYLPSGNPVPADLGTRAGYHEVDVSRPVGAAPPNHRATPS